jgi:glycosyltransferase involved in cell wall biosynthesis
MKVAIIHDWLGPKTGAERVLEQMLCCYPGADVFTAIDFLPKQDRSLLGNARVVTSFLQRLPLARTKYWNYIPLMPLAFEQFDLQGYDLVLSNSHTAAKGVIPKPEQPHVCYLQTPMRFAWDLQSMYLRSFRMERGLRSTVARMVLARMRTWDVASAARVDAFVSASVFVARRCELYYRRRSAVLYPPVDVGFFSPDDAAPEDFYLAASRLTPFKRLDLIVEAFRRLPGRRLVVIGDGPERHRIQRLAGANVSWLGYQSDLVLRDHMRRARAFIFGAAEDFGIVMAEAQACGTPVIALGQGGATEIVRPLGRDSPTGVFFERQTAEALAEAVMVFERREDEVTRAACRANALRFTPSVFREGLVRHVSRAAERVQARHRTLNRHLVQTTRPQASARE